MENNELQEVIKNLKLIIINQEERIKKLEATVEELRKMNPEYEKQVKKRENVYEKILNMYK